MTTIGVSVAVPDPWGTDLQDYRVGSATRRRPGSRPTSRCCRRSTSTTSCCRRSTSTCEAVAAATRPFHVHLRGTGTFRPVSPVVFVNVVEGISGCELLAAAVRQGPLAIDAALPLPPARHRGPPPRGDLARPGLRRAGLLRLPLHRRPVLALRAPRRRGVGTRQDFALAPEPHASSADRTGRRSASRLVVGREVRLATVSSTLMEHPCTITHPAPVVPWFLACAWGRHEASFAGPLVPRRQKAQTVPVMFR